MVDFCVGTRRSFVTLVTADSMRVVELAGPSSALADRVRLFRRIITSSDAASRAPYTSDRMTAMQRSVGDDVLGSVADVVERSQRLFVSADGFFATVPFGILILHDHGDCLMRDRDVVQIPSASVLVIERRTKQSAGDNGASVVAIASSNERLTGARDEVRDLARRYDNVQVVAGVDGAGGFEAAAGGCDVLHIAAHALVVDQSPWQSGFRVADIPASATDAIVPDRHQSAAPSFLSPADSLRVARAFRSDPYVRAWQIARLRLAARLTVLSGCETAGGRVTTGEGTLGLTAAFLSAGVPVVVSSLWPVDDRVTRLMMRSFTVTWPRAIPLRPRCAVRNSRSVAPPSIPTPTSGPDSQQSERARWASLSRNAASPYPTGRSSPLWERPFWSRSSSPSGVDARPNRWDNCLRRSCRTVLKSCPLRPTH